MGLGQTFEERRYKEALLERREQVCQKNTMELSSTFEFSNRECVSVPALCPMWLFH